MSRVILHVDMDAFFAAIEQRDEPSIAGKPVIVGGPQRRGVVSTASYEAREFGVHSAMPMAVAVRKCPDGLVLPVRMRHYRDVSADIMEVMRGFSPLVEPLSLDEAFLDMTGTKHLFGTPFEAAERIKRGISEATGGLTCSVGIACNKFLAKLASDMDKPDGITEVPRGREQEFIAPLPVERIWGVGPKTADRLRRIGIKTIGDLAGSDPKRLARLFKSQGEHIYDLARGIDDRPVNPDRDRKSVGSEETLSEDVSGRKAVEWLMINHCDRVARHLRAKGLKARGIRVKVRYSKGFRLATRDDRLPVPVDDSRGLLAGARRLLEKLDLDRPMRLVGVATFDLVEPEESFQGDLFQQEGREKRSRVEHALDDLRSRHGNDVIRTEKRG